MTVTDIQVKQFMELFQGYPRAFGTGAGGWVKRSPSRGEYKAHLEGRGVGLGIGPLMENSRCLFCAIDLDKPDFDTAGEMARLLPGTSWIERSRSGNAHVLVFFQSPIEAWVVRGIMREALAALGHKDVEVFPKSDRLLPGMFGNYLNLPYFGETRHVVARVAPSADGRHQQVEWWSIMGEYNNHIGAPLGTFLDYALKQRNAADLWRTRARWLGIPSPEERAATKQHSFGESSALHCCAEYVMEHRDTNPVTAGHRAVVYFALAKMLSNWSEVDHDEALGMLTMVNDSSPDPVGVGELERILANAERGQYTSTGCTDPLFLPYRDPNCRIEA